MTEASEVDTLLTRMVETFGSLDVMVNNAGSTRDATMRTMTEAQFDRVINVHLKGTGTAPARPCPSCGSKKSGVLVNISSLSARSRWWARPTTRLPKPGSSV
ncbi:SDR family NAD(P)-dependent oxidoreductase [Amycolatopsis taiwanensis]|uniref:SDR family NAD(P)-dependent oxidoreductase n=1 Tax=Amycolatopsis taiwanensis TaxID=342230 RepID=UPI001FE1115A|nr:SDR family NAD(P)-dependent oxidoreductase [Amycolatopsis taiwanensis]